MARTHVIDIKELTTLPETMEIREGGTRHFNLDTIFEGKLDTDDREIAGHPATTVTVSHRTGLKLAGNAREHYSRFDSKLVTLHDFFSFGGWDDKNYGRTEFQGPMVQGPHMFVHKLSVMLTAHKEPDEMALLVEEGDTVQFLGSEYRVTFPPHTNTNIKMELVKEAVTA